MPQKAGLSLVITYATDPRKGNPAYVLTEPGMVSDAVLSGVCELLRAGVIAVIDNVAGSEPTLRFFTADGLHAGTGHVTMAAAHVAMRKRQEMASFSFGLLNGECRPVSARGSCIAIGFPIMAMTAMDRISDLEDALGERPMESHVSSFGYVAVYDDAAKIAGMQPDFSRVADFDRNAIIATAPASDGIGVVIRVFAPKVGLPEDPVCGTAHRFIVPYWVERLGTRIIHSRHLSPRGGDLWCEVAGDEVIIAGESHAVMEGTLELSNQ